MQDPWATIDASSWTLAGVEQQGLHEHEWYRHDSEARTWLFKPARPDRHRSIGEDIAEKLASHLAQLLGVPAARVELATRRGVDGVLVEDARPSGWSLQHGRVLMSEAIDDYDPDDPERRGHSPVVIQAALQRFGPPPDSPLPPDFGAFDVFVGFLVFDALIAHVDRHDRNWALLVRPPGQVAPDTLCPSFDHAASLGFTLSEAACRQRLQAGTVGRWARQGRAARFEHRRGTRWQTLVTLATSAAVLAGDRTRQYWYERVQSVDHDSVADVVGPTSSRVPPVVHEFIIELISVNRERLLRELR